MMSTEGGLFQARLFATATLKVAVLDKVLNEEGEYFYVKLRLLSAEHFLGVFGPRWWGFGCGVRRVSRDFYFCSSFPSWASPWTLVSQSQR